MFAILVPFLSLFALMMLSIISSTVMMRFLVSTMFAVVAMMSLLVMMAFLTLLVSMMTLVPFVILVPVARVMVRVMFVASTFGPVVTMVRSCSHEI
jgi:hypothetical protein